MAITAYPFDNADTSETQYSQLFRELQDSGVADSISSSGFQVSGNASAMSVSIQPGFAIVRGHAVSSTAVETRTITAAASSTRLDRVVLKLDPTENAITLEVKAGTPGGGLPALTQTDTGIYEEPLGVVTVGAGVTSIALNRVADDRRFVGSRVGCWTTDTRPTGPRRGRLGLNITTGKWEFYTGSAWSDLLPSTVDNSTRWNGYTITVSTSTPAGSPTTDRIWIQPV